MTESERLLPISIVSVGNNGVNGKRAVTVKNVPGAEPSTHVKPLAVEQLQLFPTQHVEPLAAPLFTTAVTVALPTKLLVTAPASAIAFAMIVVEATPFCPANVAYSALPASARAICALVSAAPPTSIAAMSTAANTGATSAISSAATPRVPMHRLIEPAQSCSRPARSLPGSRMHRNCSAAGQSANHC